MRGRWIALVAFAAALTMFVGCGSSDDTTGTDTGGGGVSGEIGPGVTKETPLPPFEPGQEGSEKPDLPKILAFVQDSPRGFEQLMAEGLEAGAEDSGLEFKVAQSGGDVQKEVAAMEQFLVQGVGALTALPIDLEAQTPAMEETLEQGAAMLGISVGPATMQVAASQFDIGDKLGELAVEYIETELNGKANVVLLNENSIEFLKPRIDAMKERLAEVPGVKIVADIEPPSVDTEGGFQTMSTILQKEPNVDVVLGPDAIVLGALGALEAADLDSPEQFLGGIDCEEEALTKITEDGPYKVCVSTSPTIFGYAMGRFAGDWVEGKCIPQGVSILPLGVDGPDAVDTYRAQQQDPAGVFDDPERAGEYLGYYGNICYDTRDQYLAYPWAPPELASNGG